jgi:tripartite-type tricarboxylate transporter receptor subunit TctC
VLARLARTTIEKDMPMADNKPTLIHCVLALAALAFPGATTAQAQSYPSRTVTMVVTASAGGVTDILARAIGQRLSEMWGQQVVIENKGGGGHILGASQVARAAPDGHTLMVAEAGTYVINPIVYPKDKLNYDLDKDLIQVTGLVRIHHSFVVTPSLPANSLSELLALAKQKPGTITYGTAGLGSGPHLNVVRLEHVTGAKFVAVHYRGATPALTDVIGGHTNMMLISVGSALGSLETGKVKMVAIGSEKRLPDLPNIPATTETLPDYTAGTWFGLSVTAGTPRDVVMKINADVRKVIAEPAIQEQFVKKQLYQPMDSSPEEFAAFIKAETERWGKVIREQKLQMGQ